MFVTSSQGKDKLVGIWEVRETTCQPIEDKQAETDEF